MFKGIMSTLKSFQYVIRKKKNLLQNAAKNSNGIVNE